MRSDGYELRAPSAEVAAQDEATCRRLACENCRNPDLAYRPYVRPGARPGWLLYRAIAVCRSCGDATEF